MEENKEQKEEVTIQEENKPKSHKQLTEEFYKRHLTITFDAEGKELKQFNVINALLELYTRMLNMHKGIDEVREAMTFLANEWEKLNSKKIITSDDPTFVKPPDLKG